MQKIRQRGRRKARGVAIDDEDEEEEERLELPSIDEHGGEENALPNASEPPSDNDNDDNALYSEENAGHGEVEYVQEMDEDGRGITNVRARFIPLPNTQIRDCIAASILCSWPRFDVMHSKRRTRT